MRPARGDATSKLVLKTKTPGENVMPLLLICKGVRLHGSRSCRQRRPFVSLLDTTVQSTPNDSTFDGLPKVQSNCDILAD